MQGATSYDHTKAMEMKLQKKLKWRQLLRAYYAFGKEIRSVSMRLAKLPQFKTNISSSNNSKSVVGSTSATYQMSQSASMHGGTISW